MIQSLFEGSVQDAARKLAAIASTAQALRAEKQADAIEQLKEFATNHTPIAGALLGAGGGALLGGLTGLAGDEEERNMPKSMLTGALSGGLLGGGAGLAYKAYQGLPGTPTGKDWNEVIKRKLEESASAPAASSGPAAPAAPVTPAAPAAAPNATTGNPAVDELTRRSQEAAQAQPTLVGDVARKMPIGAGLFGLAEMIRRFNPSNISNVITGTAEKPFEFGKSWLTQPTHRFDVFNPTEGIPLRSSAEIASDLAAASTNEGLFSTLHKDTNGLIKKLQDAKVNDPKILADYHSMGKTVSDNVKHVNDRIKSLVEEQRLATEAQALLKQELTNASWFTRLRAQLSAVADQHDPSLPNKYMPTLSNSQVRGLSRVGRAGMVKKLPSLLGLVLPAIWGGSSNFAQRFKDKVQPK